MLSEPVSHDQTAHHFKFFVAHVVRACFPEAFFDDLRTVALVGQLL